MNKEATHRRLNILTGEWVLVSPHRALRPWQGQVEKTVDAGIHKYDSSCYLCPGNPRANGEVNPAYNSTFVFTNDFSALLPGTQQYSYNESDLLVANSERGICRVVCFSPRHDLTIAELETEEITRVIETWQKEFDSLSRNPMINYVQIFENKGQIMGCSNPHPHGQIWAQETIPVEPYKEQLNQLNYFKKFEKSMLSDYLRKELESRERIIFENEAFVLLVPFWAVWPFETMILPKRSVSNICELTQDEVVLFADVIKVATVKYDNIFNTSFPYSSGIHQAPCDGQEHKEWQMHMHFYPPLLRSAAIKKFMVGYEMLANPQRDITPEASAELLRKRSEMHYKKR